MSQTLTLQTLADHIYRLEREIAGFREELARLRALPTAAAPQPAITVLWSDKAAQRRQVGELFAAYEIGGEPAGALSLQKTMADAGLAEDELSASLIAARDE